MVMVAVAFQVACLMVAAIMMTEIGIVSGMFGNPVSMNFNGYRCHQ